MPRPRFLTRSLTHGTCVVCQGTFFVDPSAPDEPTVFFFFNVYNSYICTGKFVARFHKTDKETQSFTRPNPRFAGNVPTVNLPSFREEVYPQTYMFGQPKNHISDLQFEKFPTPSTFQYWKTVSKQKCILVQITLRNQRVGFEKSSCLLLRTILRRRGQFWEINIQTSRCLMRRSLPP